MLNAIELEDYILSTEQKLISSASAECWPNTFIFTKQSSEVRHILHELKCLNCPDMYPSTGAP